MTRPPRFHRPAGTVLVETIGVVPITSRKGMIFSIISENGERRGELLHCSLTPSGKPIVPPRPQRFVVSEEVAAKFVEGAATIAVRLREGQA